MSISVTCPCGSRLEIDEKFLGKDIPCPDCSRMLPTKTASAPPPLDVPDHRRVSGLAVTSLSLALVGAFTIVGTLAAIGVGILALRRIAREPNNLEGAEYARAGIITGGVLTFITLTTFISPTDFGVGQFLRELRMAKVMIYPPGDKIEPNDAEITRPSSQWGTFTRGLPLSQDVRENLFILYNTNEDAYIACQLAALEASDKIEVIEKTVLEEVFKSDLVDRIGRLNSRGWVGNSVVSERKPGVAKNSHEITVDLRLGGIDRRLLIQYTGKQPVGDNPRSIVLIGCARANRFSSLEDDFRKAFASFKAQKN